eukprot:2308372-Pleurochrysis_carterae.AAC.1
MVRITLHDSSFTATGRLPITVHARGFPSMPAVVSSVAREFTKSSRNECTCHEHPLSTMNPTLRAPWGKRRSCLPEWRLVCEANSASLRLKRGGHRSVPMCGFTGRRQVPEREAIGVDSHRREKGSVA